MSIRESRDFIISYRNLRRAIGILGIALPVLCLVGLIITHNPLQPSISHCYYTNARDVFVGVMLLVSLFLITYDQYDSTDAWITNMIGFFGLGIALFPCKSIGSSFSHIGYVNLNPVLSDIIHVVCAVLFFALLSIISIFFFTKSDKNYVPTRNKKKRNIIYIICGYVILVSLLVLFIVRFVLGEHEFDRKPIAFFIESVMLLAFGISWLIKGEVMFRDEVYETSSNTGKVSSEAISNQSSQ